MNGLRNAEISSAGPQIDAAQAFRCAADEFNKILSEDIFFKVAKKAASSYALLFMRRALRSTYNGLTGQEVGSPPGCTLS